MRRDARGAELFVSMMPANFAEMCGEMTRSEIAKHCGVVEKTVSRWERDTGFRTARDCVVCGERRAAANLDHNNVCKDCDGYLDNPIPRGRFVSGGVALELIRHLIDGERKNNLYIDRPSLPQTVSVYRGEYEHFDAAFKLAAIAGQLKRTNDELRDKGIEVLRGGAETQALIQFDKFVKAYGVRSSVRRGL